MGSVHRCETVFRGRMVGPYWTSGPLHALYMLEGKGRTGLQGQRVYCAYGRSSKPQALQKKMKVPSVSKERLYMHRHT